MRPETRGGPSTWRSMAKTAAATVAYGVVHSVLADRATKDAVARLLGDRQYRGLYRAFYQAQSVATLVALVAYVRSLPDRELYHARGPAALALRIGQASALLAAGWTVLEIGPGRFSGLDNLAAWASGRPHLPRAAEGHGPSADRDGSMHVAGPYRWTRHPAHLAFPLLTWFQPRMTANLLAYNLVATAYFALGAAREEARLRDEFGREYDDYRMSGVPFLVPSPMADGPGPA